MPDAQHYTNSPVAHASWLCGVMRRAANTLGIRMTLSYPHVPSVHIWDDFLGYVSHLRSIPGSLQKNKLVLPVY